MDFNIFLLQDNINNGFHNITLNFISVAAILSGIFVIISKNPIVSVLFLIGLFLSISIYLMLLGINFIGLSYLLVYVGAVSILFLFILMLINIRISEIISATKNSIPLAIIIGTSFFSTIYKILPNTGEYNENDFLNNFFYSLKGETKKHFYNVSDLITGNEFKPGENIFNYNIYNNNPLSYVYSNNWEVILAENSHINTIGNILYTSFPLWIILTSLILLLAMVGAIIITLKN